MECARGVRYKLRMMGIPIAGPTYSCGDNMSVIYNTQTPESTLKKKHNELCDHAISESVAMGETLSAHIPTALNPADLGAKIFPGGARRDELIGIFLHDIVERNTAFLQAIRKS